MKVTSTTTIYHNDINNTHAFKRYLYSRYDNTLLLLLLKYNIYICIYNVLLLSSSPSSSRRQAGAARDRGGGGCEARYL